MNSETMSRLIVENIPLFDRVILKEDLLECVCHDYHVLGLTFSNKQFNSTLSYLHGEQLVFVFENGFVGLTGMGKHRFK